MIEAPQASGTGATAAPADDRIGRIAAQLRHWRQHDTGALARLRRHDPLGDPQASLFERERLLLAAGLPRQPPDAAWRWAVLLHAMALAHGAHGSGPGAEPGHVLAGLHFSELRLRQLLEADADFLADLLPRIARRLGAAGLAVNWRPFAALLLYTGTPLAARADAARLRIARHYLLHGERNPAADRPAGPADPPAPMTTDPGDRP